MPSTPTKENTSRLRCFKNRGKDQDEMRRRRTDVTVELRKAKKDEQLLKRRNLQVEADDSPLQESNKPIPLDLNLPSIIANISSPNPQAQFSGVQSCRKLLSKEKSPPIDTVIENGIVAKLVEFLGRFDNHKLQFEAAWALTNVASGTSEQTMVVVESGAVPYFVRLLSSEHTNVVDQAVWALGNIAGNGAECRDFTVRCGIIQPLIALITKTTGIAHLRNITWTLSNLCRNKDPAPSFEAVQQVLPALAHLIHHEDREVISDTCWALSYLTDSTTERIQAVIDADVVGRLVQLLGSSEISCVTPALRAVGNIVTGSDHQTQLVLECGALSNFNRLLSHPRSNIQKEAAWTISNITAGQPSQIQAVIDMNLIQPLLKIMIQGEYKAQKEAVWAITNLTAGGHADQILHLLEAGALKPLCDLLVVKDAKIVQVILDAIMNILNVASKRGVLDQVCVWVEECEGLDKIEALQQHSNQEVYKLSLAIIDKYFSEEEEDQSVAPMTSSTGFQFAPAAQSIASGGFTF